MTRRKFDIDVDISPNVERTDYGVRASLYNEEQKKLVPHPSGVFLNGKEYTGIEVPVDQVTGLSALDAKEGEELGHFKVDLLNNSSYGKFDSKEQVKESLNDLSDFDWGVFLKKDVVESLPHIANHFTTVRQVAPKSIQELADVLALIRPGKIELLDDYLEDPERIRKQLYKRPLKGMYFKKSHAVAYAAMIVSIVNKKDKTETLFFD